MVSAVWYIHIYPTQLAQNQLQLFLSLANPPRITKKQQGIKQNASPYLCFDHMGMCRINTEFRVARKDVHSLSVVIGVNNRNASVNTVECKPKNI